MLSLVQILVALTTKGDALIVVEAWVLSLSKMQGDMLNLFARLMPWMPHFCGPVYNWQINYFSFNIDHPTYTWSIYALIQTSLGNKLILYTLYFIHLNEDILIFEFGLVLDGWDVLYQMGTGMSIGISPQYPIHSHMSYATDSLLILLNLLFSTQITKLSFIPSNSKDDAS